ncbi:hypothetical protein BKN38_08515 [Helicobacter sp. CLO-3]|uniref:efflux RND transporter periplasmic adaptor subunit n=1 Tax=unclassified Helicobacter TaxID=2593540 RepID=UPI0008050F07|nr:MULTISPECIES: efflux RND transporter periplasmic adaptor subunit [unclassified Helicobacter]OBV29092.1 hypothetical protein BA723_06890 [Helicobacter sp. CLO-3]OHU81669.1 hypothetical protein BKN38_08515 [Helicobacter sp. CLO-3]
MKINKAGILDKIGASKINTPKAILAVCALGIIVLCAACALWFFSPSFGENNTPPSDATQNTTSATNTTTTSAQQSEQNPATPNAPNAQNPKNQTKPAQNALFKIPLIAPKRQNIGDSMQYFGIIKEDESRIHSLSVRADGFIEQLFIADTYAQVKKGAPLFTFYAPEIIDAQSELLGTFDSRHRHLAREKLALLGVHEKEIKAIESKRAIKNAIAYYAPFDGVVFTKNANVGAGAKRGDEVFRIVNLDKVWVIASIPQEDLGLLLQASNAAKTGAKIPESKNAPESKNTKDALESKISESAKTSESAPESKNAESKSAESTNTDSSKNSSADSDKNLDSDKSASQSAPESTPAESTLATLQARATLQDRAHAKPFALTFDMIYPEANQGLLQARFIAENPTKELFPKAFVTITLNIAPSTKLTLPQSAILRKNGKFYVFVYDDEGSEGEKVLLHHSEFMPREIEARKILGSSFYEILSGLGENDLVAKDALFVLDSDAQNNGDFDD